MPCKGRIFCWRDRRQLHFDFVTNIKVQLKSIQKVSVQSNVWTQFMHGIDTFRRKLKRMCQCVYYNINYIVLRSTQK